MPPNSSTLERYAPHSGLGRTWVERLWPYLLPCGTIELHQSKPGGVRARKKYHSKDQGILACPKIQEVEVASETIESDHETPSHLFIDKNFEACLEQLDWSSPMQYTERQSHNSHQTDNLSHFISFWHRGINAEETA